MTDDHLAYANDIARYKARFALCRDDIGPVSEYRLNKSLKALRPPGAPMSEDEVRAAVEPSKVRWHKDIIRNLRTTPSTPETVPYYRWSTDKQQYSIEYQRNIVERYYARRSARMPPMSVHEFADPETSGKHFFVERQFGGTLMSYLRPRDHVIFPYFDRMGRDMLDTLRTLQVLMKLNVFVHLIDHPSYGFCDPNHPNTVSDLQRHASANEHERRMTAFRVRNTHRATLSEGRLLGSVGDFCYSRIPNPNYVPGVKDNVKNPRYLAKFCPHDAAVCDEAYRLWLEGWTAYEIGQALFRKGIRRRAMKNRRWGADDLRRVIIKLHQQRASLNDDGYGAAGH